MSKLRLLFVKEAQASYISHLDLLRTFQRAFPRTGLEIRHSQGYHPHPLLSIVLPLPVGQSSVCELMELEVMQETDGAGIAARLNGGLPSGLRVLDCYPAQRPIRELANLQAAVEMEYDRGVPAGAADKLRRLFARPELLVSKRTKRKELAEVNIAPMIRRAEIAENGGVIRAEVVVQAQNPGLNPQLLAQAAARYLPELTPDFVRVRRTAILDADGRDFL